MSLRVPAVLAVLALALLVVPSAAPAASAGVGTVVQVDQPPGGVAEEAPSSIDTGDSVRAFLVLTVCVVVIAVPVGLTVIRARRRQRSASDPGEA